MFTSLTVTVKLFVSLNDGEPLLVNTVVKVLVVGPCDSPGVQVIIPLAEMAALVTGPELLVTIKV